MATQSSSVKLTVKSVVRGYHIFKEVWDPWRGDQFYLQIEEFNRYDRYAVAVTASLAKVSAEVFEGSKRVKHRGLCCHCVRYCHVDVDVPKLEDSDKIRTRLI